MGDESVINGVTSGTAQTSAIVDRIWAALRWSALPCVLLVGLLIRLATARFLPLHFDEGAMLLGVYAVAERGWPLLPSGVLYLHGVTLSYLLAPLVWLGWGELDDLFLLRMVSAVLGTIAVALTYHLARAVVSSTAPALLAAALVALDPVSVVWSGWLRMYALEQALAVAVAWLFVRQVVPEAGTVTPDGRRRELAGLVVAFWLAVFAQLGAALLWPGMAAAAVLLHGRALLGTRRILSVALGFCALAPVAFLAASTWGGAAGAAAQRDGSGPLPVGSFLGDHLVNLQGVLHPSPGAWTALFGVGALAGFVPWLVCLLSGLLCLVVGRAFLAVASGRGGYPRWRPIAAVLLLYWVPVLAFVGVATVPRARYLVFLQPLGYVLVGAAVMLLWTSATRPVTVSRRTRLLGAAAVGLALLLVIHLGDGLRRLDDWAAREGAIANRVEAIAYVRAHRAPNEPIFVSWPPDAYLVLGKLPKIRALGPLPTGRDVWGQKTDFWVGWPVTDVPKDACRFLANHPGAWFVLDPRLDSSRALRDLAKGSADVIFPPSRGVSGGSTLVLRLPPSGTSSMARGAGGRDEGKSIADVCRERAPRPIKTRPGPGGIVTVPSPRPWRLPVPTVPVQGRETEADPRDE